VSLLLATQMGALFKIVATLASLSYVQKALCEVQFWVNLAT